MLPDDWRQRASEAAAFARGGWAASGIPGLTCFMAHQAAEFALKGVLAASGQDPPRVHSLPLLLRACRKAGQALQADDRDADRLDPWYIQGRYVTAAVAGATPADAEAALAAAERLVRACGIGPA